MFKSSQADLNWPLVNINNSQMIKILYFCFQRTWKIHIQAKVYITFLQLNMENYANG